jgi:hypothetical protein
MNRKLPILTEPSITEHEYSFKTEVYSSGNYVCIFNSVRLAVNLRKN